MKEKEFLEKFESMTLPADKFNHRGHLWLGWLYIRDYELGEASSKLNEGIKKFAESLGANDKFNYTLTTTFACLIKSRFKKNQTFEEFLDKNNDALENSISKMEKHYSPKLLYSDKARKELVSPDRMPFPEEFEVELSLK